MNTNKMTGKKWEYLLTEALKRLGGEGHISDITRELKLIAQEKNWSTYLPKTVNNSVQEQLQQLSSDSEKNEARGRPDLFEMLIKTEGWNSKGRYRLRGWAEEHKKEYAKDPMAKGGGGTK